MDNLLPPSNIEAEQSVLGSLLVDYTGDAFEVASGLLSSKDFYLARHQWIYQAISDIVASGLNCDYLTLSNKLTQRGQFEEVGGYAYLTQLTTVMPHAMFIESYAKMVKNDSLNRQMIAVSQKITRMAYEGDNDAIESLSRGQQLMFELGNETTASFRPIGDAMDFYLDELEQYEQNPERFDGLTLGIDEIDNFLQGLQPGDLCVMAGRPGAGKTTIALDVALRVAKRGEAVGIFSLEMTDGGLLHKFVANELAIDSVAIKNRKLSASDRLSVTKCLPFVKSLPIFIDDSPSQTIAQIISKARRKIRENNLKLLVIDYLQLIKPDNANAKRFEQISAISRGLKLMARELGIPVIALSQLNRAVELSASKEPNMGHLAEGSGIEKDADSIVFLWLPDEDDAPNIVSIKVAKNRTGATGVAKLMFQKQYSRFRPLTFERLDY